MKRLLADLIVVISLVMTFSVNGNAEKIPQLAGAELSITYFDKSFQIRNKPLFFEPTIHGYVEYENQRLKGEWCGNKHSDCHWSQDGKSFQIKFERRGRQIVLNGKIVDKIYVLNNDGKISHVVKSQQVQGNKFLISGSIKLKKHTSTFYGYLTPIYYWKETQIAKAEPDTSSADKAKIEKEKKKIAEEKRKIEEEKRKIAEAKKKQEEEEKKRKEANSKLYVIGSGTGFFVSSAGHAVSNEHVVGICKKVATKIEGEKVFFNILKTDKVNDIGLIKGGYKSSSFLNIKSDGAEFGEDIVAFGYPLSDKLSSSVKLSRGIVSSLSGPNDNYSEIQIDAAIQPGNSGGPVLNMEGQVVGIASSGLNKVLMLLDEDQPYIPENINFAVAAPTLLNFLKSNGVKTKSEALEINNTKELAKIGRPATIQLFCLNTKAKYEELKKKKKHNNVLLEKVVELN